MVGLRDKMQATLQMRLGRYFQCSREVVAIQINLLLLVLFNYLIERLTRFDLGCNHTGQCLSQ